ncbi:hypothetical protein HPB50_024352 [Hyalomma asiaticum]|uniref:Uncharacterized protein n=1 Tax=Hyalomma asiaticum TaxID=266040 RepID=A0ACB7S1E5_HYAAI|nr:hypothetical protein HPB50_024352 [Hyalomma asiaticum]
MERPVLSSDGGGNPGTGQQLQQVQEQNERSHNPAAQSASGQQQQQQSPQQGEREILQEAHREAREQSVPVPRHREAYQQQEQRREQELQESRQRRRQTRLEGSSFDSSSSEESSAFTATSSTTLHSQMSSGHSATSMCCDVEARRRDRRSTHRDTRSPRVPLTYRPMGWSGLFTMRIPPSLMPFSLEAELRGPLLQLPLDLCNALRQEAGHQGTVLLSPHHVACTIIMMHHGAAGETRRQLGRLLGLSDVDADPLGDAVDVDTATCGAGLRPRPIMDVFGLHACMLACSDFHRPRTKLGPAGAMTSYLALCHDASIRLADRYHRPLVMFSPQIHAMDFATCAEECRLYIDGLFRALSDFSFERPLFTSDCVGPDSRLVFASMALFDSKLPAQFQPSRGWFRNACGGASAVRTLRRLGAPYRTARCDDIAATVLEVPYNSPLLESMVVFLPDSPFGGLASLERSLSKDKIMDCLARLEQRGLVDVTLPRLRLRCCTDFARLLPSMGVRDAFGEAADFSNMAAVDDARNDAGGGRLKVSAAKHFAVFRAGLRSAGTGVADRLATPPPVVDRADGRNIEFTVDRPFLFLVLGKEPSSVFLFGSVSKPSA